MNGILSPQFVATVNQALQMAKDPTITRDDSRRWMASNIPIFLEDQASPQEAEAAGCPWCTYLGMWTPDWPGFPRSEHGLILLFEDAIRSMRGDLVANVYQVLTHEMDHALQRDHVLDAMEAERKAAAASGYNIASNGQSARGCGCPGGR